MQKSPNNFAEAFRFLKRNGKVTYQYEIAKAMDVNKDTITRVIRGYSRATDDFLDKFNRAYGDVFNFHWLRGDSDIMLAKDMDRPKPEPEPQEEIRHTTTIVELYAQLIKEVESIRRELTAQLERTQQLNDHLEAQISRLEALGLSTDPSEPLPITQSTGTLRFARHGHNAVSYALTDLPESKPLSVAEQPVSGHETAENGPATSSPVHSSHSSNPSKPSKRKPRPSAPASASPSAQSTSSASSSVPGLPDHIYRQQPKPSKESPSSSKEAPESPSDPSCTPA